MLASNAGKENVVEYLLSVGAAVNIKSDVRRSMVTFGWIINVCVICCQECMTALHFACLLNNFRICSMLIRREADVTIRDVVSKARLYFYYCQLFCISFYRAGFVLSITWKARQMWLYCRFDLTPGDLIFHIVLLLWSKGIVIEQHKDAIHRSLLTGDVVWHRSQLILAGGSQTGKTSLANALLGKPLAQTRRSCGIERIALSLTNAGSTPVSPWNERKEEPSNHFEWAIANSVLEEKIGSAQRKPAFSMDSRDDNDSRYDTFSRSSSRYPT
jgi:hypothetical protein